MAEKWQYDPVTGYPSQAPKDKKFAPAPLGLINGVFIICQTFIAAANFYHYADGGKPINLACGVFMAILTICTMIRIESVEIQKAIHNGP